MRAFLFALLLAGCAAQPLGPLPDSGRVWTEACHPVSASAYEAAPVSATAGSAGAIGDVAVTARGGPVDCRWLDDGSAACSVRGEAYLRAGAPAEVRHFHVPAGRIGTVNRLGGELVCRTTPA